MQPTPIKKFEKISSEGIGDQRLVLTKITDFRDKMVFYEVKRNGSSRFFKNLKDAQMFLKTSAQ